MDYSLPGFSIHGIFQARVLEWGAIAPWLKQVVNKCPSPLSSLPFFDKNAFFSSSTQMSMTKQLAIFPLSHP